MTTKIGEGSIVIEVWLKSNEALSAQSPADWFRLNNEPVDFSKYDHVADLCLEPKDVPQIGPGDFDTDCLEAAFLRTQNVDEGSWNPEAPCRSSMPGDVLVLKSDTAGESTPWYIDHVGFKVATK